MLFVQEMGGFVFWGMENTWYGTAFTIGSIPPAFAVQYYALGSQGYYDYYKNFERNY